MWIQILNCICLKLSCKLLIVIISSHICLFELFISNVALIKLNSTYTIVRLLISARFKYKINLYRCSHKTMLSLNFMVYCWQSASQTDHKLIFTFYPPVKFMIREKAFSRLFQYNYYSLIYTRTHTHMMHDISDFVMIKKGNI